MNRKSGYIITVEGKYVKKASITSGKFLLSQDKDVAKVYNSYVIAEYIAECIGGKVKFV
ncbi:hypothetical protein MOC90_06155 [Bacillus spizizenii]|nr:hypothetical protein [Bacillus spizizenii]MCY8219396.1 hypothetical protein [Bacillus spizizenii]MCY8362120.1 hypothetical protein [Bacillus spizizenii]MCY8368688.1 hypothetical protein [Bacillus spizizenii]